MPSGYGPWQAEDRGHGGLLLLLAALVAVGAGVHWLLADTIFLPVAISVVSVLCVAGTVRIVRELWSTRGMAVEAAAAGGGSCPGACAAGCCAAGD